MFRASTTGHAELQEQEGQVEVAFQRARIEHSRGARRAVPAPAQAGRPSPPAYSRSGNTSTAGSIKRTLRPDGTLRVKPALRLPRTRRDNSTQEGANTVSA